MQKINYKSDIKIVESYPATDNFVYHFTTDEKVCYDVSLEIGNCKKVEPECGCGKAKLIICLDHHGLNIGQLKVKREMIYDDSDFPDGKYNKIVENKYDIFLVQGAGTEPSEIEIDGYMPIFRGEKGDAYEITEEDYEKIAELASEKIDLSDYYTKEEIDEKFQDKYKFYSEDEETNMATIQVSDGEGLQSEINVSPERVYIGHTGPLEQCNGNIQINSDGILLSHEGYNDTMDTDVRIADGKLYVNDQEVAISTMETVEWPTFNRDIMKPQVGWKRVLRINAPGTSSGYNGFAYTQRFEDQIKQLFFVDETNTILYRNYKFSYEEIFDTSWKEIQKGYSGGSGISVSDAGVISINQDYLKTDVQTILSELNLNMEDMKVISPYQIDMTWEAGWYRVDPNANKSRENVPIEIEIQLNEPYKGVLLNVHTDEEEGEDGNGHYHKHYVKQIFYPHGSLLKETSILLRTMEYSIYDDGMMSMAVGDRWATVAVDSDIIKYETTGQVINIRGNVISADTYTTAQIDEKIEGAIPDRGIKTYTYNDFDTLCPLGWANVTLDETRGAKEGSCLSIVTSKKETTDESGQVIEYEYEVHQVLYEKATGKAFHRDGTLTIKKSGDNWLRGYSRTAKWDGEVRYTSGHGISISTDNVISTDSYTKDETDAKFATKEEIPEPYDDTEIRNEISDLGEDYEYVEGEVSKLKDKVDELQLYKFPNVTIYGQPTINNGQVSGFSNGNYLQMPFVVDFANRPYRIDFNFTSGADVTNQQNIIDSEYGLAVAVRNSRLVVAISSNGTSWDGEYVADALIEAESTYNTSIEYDGYVLTVTINDEPKTFDNVGYPYPKQIIIGKGISNHTFSGSVNLNYAKLTISDKVVWQGMDDVGIATRAAVDLSNIDAEGENKIKEIASDIPLKTINGETIKGDGDITIESGGDLYYIGFNSRYGTNKFALYIEKNGEYITNASINVHLYENNGTSTASISKSGIWYYFQYYPISLVAEIIISVGDVKIYSTLVPIVANLQQKLNSGSNIKTINGQSILGSGNIEIQGGGGDETDPIWNAEKGNYYTIDEADERLALVSDNLSNRITDVEDKASAIDGLEQAVSGLVAEVSNLGSEVDEVDNRVELLNGEVAALSQDLDNRLFTDLSNLDDSGLDLITATATAAGEAAAQDMPLKTINGEDIHGTGDIVIQGGGGNYYEKVSGIMIENFTRPFIQVSDNDETNVFIQGDCITVGGQVIRESDIARWNNGGGGDYLPLSGGTLKGRVTVGDKDNASITNAYTHLRKVNDSFVGMAFSVGGDATASIQHKAYGTDFTSARNDAVLRFDATNGLEFGTAASGNVSTYKKVLLEDALDRIVWSGTQAEYDALTDKSLYKLYLIQDVD